VNEDAAVEAIRTLIYNNRATLVSGLTMVDGQARSIRGLYSNPFIPPTEGYYHVVVSCLGAQEIETPEGGGNTFKMVWSAAYDMQIEVADYAEMQQGEREIYQLVVRYFRLFVDRIVKLLEDTDWYPSAAATPRFRLEHRTGRSGNVGQITKRNIYGAWDTAENFEPMLYSVITFRIFEHHSQPNLLYA